LAIILESYFLTFMAKLKITIFSRGGKRKIEWVSCLIISNLIDKKSSILRP
jgi:hypothetical protein